MCKSKTNPGKIVEDFRKALHDVLQSFAVSIDILKPDTAFHRNLQPNEWCRLAGQLQFLIETVPRSPRVPDWDKDSPSCVRFRSSPPLMKTFEVQA
jgi:hypothetical protein